MQLVLGKMQGQGRRAHQSWSPIVGRPEVIPMPVTLTGKPVCGYRGQWSHEGDPSVHHWKPFTLTSG